MGSDAIVKSLPPAATQACSETILEDYRSAVAYIELGLRVKFDCFKRLPWAIASLAHYQLHQRQEGARTVLRLYDHSVHAGFPVDQHHPVTRKFLDEGCGSVHKLVPEFALTAHMQSP